MAKNYFSILLSCLFSFFTNLGYAVCTQEELTGKAFELASTQKEKNSSWIYTETYQRLRENGVLRMDQVDYTDPQGKRFARKRVVYDKSLSHPSFKLIDIRANYLESAEVINDVTHITYQAPGKQKANYTQLKLPAQAVHDAGFNPLITQHWQELLQGKKIPMQFLAPSRASYLDFMIIPADQHSETQVKVTLKATQALYAWAIQPIELIYNRDTQQLKTFSGLTNVKNKDGKNFRAQIDYSYQKEQVIPCPKNLTQPLSLFNFETTPR